MSHRGSKRSPRLRQHATLASDLTNETELIGNLEARLPCGIFQRLMLKTEGISQSSERIAYLMRATSIVDACVDTVEEADHIICTGPRSADVYRNGTMHKAVSINWAVLTHIALGAGWVLIGNRRLERSRARRATTPPSSQDAPDLETYPPDPGTTPDKGQVELIVVYEADGAQFIPRVRGEELLEFRLDGQVMEPPAPTLDGVYRWLGTNGYVPDGDRFKWLDKHEGRRRRRQVYVHQPREVTPERRLTHAQAWNVARGYRVADL